MPTVPLAFRHLGGQGNSPMVLLHGLLGSSRNWISSGRDLARQHEIFALDLRNHGESPHADNMRYGEMAADVIAFLDAHGLDHVHLLGHSLGGKVAMRVAMDAPERIEKLTVVDIAPREYRPYNLRNFDAMNALPLKELTSRKDADARLTEAIPDWAQRQFVLTNLTRDDDGRFRWIINLPVLTTARDDMRANAVRDGETFTGPTLFIAGGQSYFIQPEDHDLIHRYFPNARIETVPESGHNVHMDAREAFVKLVEEA